jgi:DNA-binding MarR family transcriptional regulator
MAQPRQKRTRRLRNADEERWAELADLMLIIAREISVRPYTDARAHHLTQSEGTVMRHLHTEPDAAPSRIAAVTGLQRTNLSTVLRSLESKGLVERHPTPDDARGVRVHLTDRGRTNYRVVRHEGATTLHTAADSNADNLDAALDLLAKIRTGLTSDDRR